MLGWLVDFIRLVWGLLYWNTRKTLFRLRRGRSRPPCQSPSDSGRAMETHCDACLHWDKPSRFKRVCPLLVAKNDELFCSANAADVRPFWGRVARYYGGTLLTIYAIGVLSVFIFLRSVGYPVSILHVGLPPLWYRVPQARGWFFVEKSNRAFAAGKINEGILNLNNAYQFDPTNYAAGLTLAKHYQVGQSKTSDDLYARLLTEHPEQRSVTAQEWFRALLARGDFARATQLAQEEMVRDLAHAQAWMRGLLFTTRQTGDTAPLKAILADPAPAAVVWRQLIQTELLFRSGRTREARAALQSPWTSQSPAFTVYYQVHALTVLGDTFAALDLLARQPPGRLDDEASVTLRLDAYAAGGNRNLIQREIDRLLAQPNLPRIKILCAHFIRRPDAALFGQLFNRLDQFGLPLNNETAGVWFSVLCTAGAVGDQARFQALATRLKRASGSSFVALDALDAFYRSTSADKRITAFLPVLPLPLEVNYALIERFPGPSRVTAKTP